MTSSHAIRVARLSKVYGESPHRVVALDDVDLAFERGTFAAIMGPSGSGKTTLMQCAAGLDQPSSGEVLLGDGTRIGTLSEQERTALRRDRIGFVFQSYNLLPSLTAEQNVALPLRLAGRRTEPGRIQQLLAEVGMGDRVRHRPDQLSNGQQQRVAIARSLATEPDVLFADEPTGALDSRTGLRVLELFRSLVDQRGQTVVLVTHDPVAASFADRLTFLVDGRVVEQLDEPSAPVVAQRMALLESSREVS